MIETASVLAAYFAFALLHAANPRRIPFGILSRLRSKRAWAPAARAFAVVFFSWSVWLWSRVEPGPAAILVAFTAFMGAASVFVLLAPVWPRAVWSLAILCPPAVAALSFVGVFYG